MRRFIPTTGTEELEDLYLDLDFPPSPPHRPHVYLDMVASADGAATIDGRTRDLGGDADRVAFSRLREWCDVLLVGAGTVRIEDYGPPRPSAEARARRVSRGLAATPRIAVVSARLTLNPGSRLFDEDSEAGRPIILTVEDADPDRRRALEAVADVVAAGSGRVDLPAVFRRLRTNGTRRILCEGGPTLNASLLRHSLVDELFLTVSPQLVGEAEHRILELPLRGAPVELSLVELREHDSELLLRYRILDAA